MEYLFSEPYDLDLLDSNICYFPGFLSTALADAYFNTLLTETKWQQDEIKIFGKTHPQPRLTALYASNSKSYSYASICMQPLKFTETLVEIKQKVEAVSTIKFTSCLLNLYRDGKDSNGWHADNEKELGKNPVIASITLGQERMFHLKHRSDKTLKHKILLQHGSLLLMQGETQHHWLHQIPKSARPMEKRINLTFRVIQ